MPADPVEIASDGREPRFDAYAGRLI